MEHVQLDEGKEVECTATQAMLIDVIRADPAVAVVVGISGDVVSVYAPGNDAAIFLRAAADAIQEALTACGDTDSGNARLN